MSENTRARLAADDRLLHAIVKIKRYNKNYKKATRTPGTVTYFHTWSQTFSNTYSGYVEDVILVIRAWGCPGVAKDVEECINVIRFFGLTDKADELQAELDNWKAYQ